MRRAGGVLLVLLVLLLGACGGDADQPRGSRGRIGRFAPAARATSPSPITTPSLSPSPLPPDPAAPFRFAVIGDFGAANDAEWSVAARMCRWHDLHPFSLVLTTGDNVYPDGAPSDFDAAFKQPFDCLFDRGVSFRASLGNHDIATDNGAPEIADPAFGMRGHKYVVRRGGVRFVIFDSNQITGPWLTDALRSEPGDRWTVVVFHHPVFSSGTGHGSTPGFRPWMPRLFRRNGVDLVLNGHDHIYAVSDPLRRIRYVVTGGGGARLYDCRARWFTDRCAARHHFLTVVAGADEITVRAVPPAGRPFDSFKTSGR
ncbi:MAG: metallophosphoesterase [Actinomycetota bacterium]|nr:metallophosphoesterase [Actinomycetota bacterium]